MTSPVLDGPGSRRDRTPPPVRLKKRAEFLAVAAGRRYHAEPFSLQALVRPEPGISGSRFGLTVTRKTGTAVERNRIKRRLRAILSGDAFGRPDSDYVIVARRNALSLPFGRLAQELSRSIDRVHAAKPPHRRDSTRSARSPTELIERPGHKS